ncbi:DUF5937 family protein [Streptomyces sp. NPDC051776]|uniref:ArsR/SmtB family transcription factor n=1 Tax=Streptomyces sp. NPDC051776 TaxID=3155414 RepID=UPI00343183D3
MICYEATADDVSKVKFSPSPLGEAVYSFRMLASPERRKLHAPWVSDVRARLKGVDFGPLRAVVPPTGYVPDFLTPAPGAEPAGITEELEMVRSTAPEHFVDEVAWMAADTGTPAVWRVEAEPMHRRMLAEPGQAIRTVTKLLDVYWRLALEPHWRRLHGGLRSDIRSRTRVLETSGTASVFSSLNRRIGWSEGRITVRSAYDFTEKLGGRGLVLVPSIFCGPEVLTMLPPLGSMIVYPRPDVSEIWSRQRLEHSSALASLMGSVRAAVIEALVTPATTTELATAIDVTPGAISQHVGVLRDCNLVLSRRAGRRVIHSLTETGEALVLGSRPVAHAA